MLNCDQCNIMYINGVRCHETGCPDAWKEPKECKWCGSIFIPDTKDQICCSEDCAEAYNN